MTDRERSRGSTAKAHNLAWRRPLAAAGAALALAALAPATAHASACVSIDAERDGLAEDERQSARTLFEEALGEAGVGVVREGCNETWTLYHVLLGRSITVVVQSPSGTRRERVESLEDLPALYHQLTHAILNNTENTNEAVDRRNVTSAQNQRRRVAADAIWYTKLGYGSTSGDGFHGGPAFGFGRRWELDRIGINLSFLNFILYQDADEFDGTSVGWIELGADYFVDPYASSSAYFGAGLSIGTHSIPSDRGHYENAGLQGKVSAGYEFFRASNIRLLLHGEATLPMFRASRTTSDPVTLIETEDHIYAPTFQLCLGLGWGTLSN
jgi:hypothetical protein